MIRLAPRDYPLELALRRFLPVILPPQSLRDGSLAEPPPTICALTFGLPTVYTPPPSSAPRLRASLDTCAWGGWSFDEWIVEVTESLKLMSVSVTDAP